MPLSHQKTILFTAWIVLSDRITGPEQRSAGLFPIRYSEDSSPTIQESVLS